MKELVEAQPKPSPATPHLLSHDDTLLRAINTGCTLQGSLCNYVVDSESSSIEMTDGLITDLLDCDAV